MVTVPVVTRAIRAGSDAHRDYNAPPAPMGLTRAARAPEPSLWYETVYDFVSLAERGVSLLKSSKSRSDSPKRVAPGTAGQLSVVTDRMPTAELSYYGYGDDQPAYSYSHCPSSPLSSAGCTMASDVSTVPSLVSPSTVVFPRPKYPSAHAGSPTLPTSPTALEGPLSPGLDSTMRRRRGSMPRSPTSPSLGYSAPFRPAESPSLDPPPPYPGIAGGRPGWGLNALEGGCDENAARRC